MAETPRHVRATDRTPMSVGGYTRTIDTPVDPFNNRVLAFLNDDASELEEAEKLTAEQIKAAALLAQREDRAAQDRFETIKNGDAFAAGRPEYVDNDPNAHLLLNQARTMFGNGVITIKQFESAYEYLRTNTNFLKLDPKELAKQQKAADKARFDAAQQPVTPSEQELYDMDLDDLRRLDAVENQRRMQLIGERGGDGF